MFTEIDHIAIAVHDIDKAMEFYASVFGAQVEHQEVVQKDQVHEALLRVADSYIQLLMPTSQESPVWKFLVNRGEGLHHVGYRVDSCQEALNSVISHGYQAIDQVPRRGSRGTTIAFIHPKSAFGTLIELVEL